VSTLELRHINKVFDQTTVIEDVNLLVADGEFVVFVGPSGCGKSTLLRLIAGLDSVTGGDVLIDSVVVNASSAADRGCAMVFQSYALYPHMSVYANMAFGLENAKMPKAEIERKVADVAALLRLDSLLQRKPTQLSGGQRQRVAIGRAIVRNPKIFLFDEPLSNLDAELRVSMRMELRQLHRRLQSTMIYVTHDQVEAMTMADKIVVLRAGKIEQVGTPQELYEFPANMFVAGFIGSPRMNFVSVELVKVLTHLGLRITSKAHTVGVRPEHWVACYENQGLPVLVVSSEYLGSQTLVHGQLSDGTHVDILTDTSLVSNAGHVIHMSFDASKVHVFDASGLRLS
jgi:multiple sugar transport system ATP-binding protein